MKMSRDGSIFENVFLTAAALIIYLSLTEPGLMQEYIVLKQGLAARFRYDRESYVEGKTGFVKEILRLWGFS